MMSTDALKNWLVAARAANYVQAGLSVDSVQSGALFEAIPVRQNTRSVYAANPQRGRR